MYSTSKSKMSMMVPPLSRGKEFRKAFGVVMLLVQQLGKRLTMPINDQINFVSESSNEISCVNFNNTKTISFSSLVNCYILPKKGEYNMTFKSTFSEDIRKARKTKGWTQAKVAEDVSVDVRAYQNWEEGKHVPELPNFFKLVNLFDLDANDYRYLSFDRDTSARC